MRISRLVHSGHLPRFAGVFTTAHTLSTPVESVCEAGGAVALSTTFPPWTGCGEPDGRKVRLYSPAAGTSSAHSPFGRHETDLSAERTQAEPQARIPCSHVDARRARDPQAPPGQGPRAPLGVAAVQRRNRLSRSRDFDAVYRHGRSASTRFLTLWGSSRGETIGEPRLGFAVPKAVGNAVVRNKIKRQLREIVRGRLEAEPPTNDYVLVIRQGLPEAVESNGHVWLEERVDEVLSKAAA